MKVAIAGFGLEGHVNYRYWNTPGNELTIVDEREVLDDIPAGAKTILGPDALKELDGFDVVIRTAGLNPKKIHTNGKIWSGTNEFFAKCPALIIGVTGTKGKGTTCSLIVSILRAAGHTVYLVGNIGTPALEILPKIRPDDIVVYELSSFQLWDAEKSPHIAVVLMIEPDHLDVHADMDEYVEAKANIVKYQTAGDILVFNRDDQLSSEIASRSVAQKIAYPFDISEYVSSLKLPGKHNEDNASAAIAVARSFAPTDDEIRKGLSDFTGLPHRLKFVREVNGVKYYDDSIATTPGSAIAAVNSFDERVTLILGGHEKGADLSELIKVCHDTQVLVIAIGKNRQHIAELCVRYGVKCSVEPGDMTAIVRRAATETEEGGVVILSPAAASFDMFKNYADRGDQFVAAVEEL